MPSITSAGIGSGLDIKSLVGQLVAAEGQPASQRFDREEAGIQAEISALGSLKGGLSDLVTKLTSLQNLDTFATRKATSADTTVLSASASSAATNGNYAIEVVKLAQGQKLSSAGFAASTTAVGGGTLTLTTGTGNFAVTIAAGQDSLAEVRDAINNAPDNSGVAATLVTVDAAGGGSETRLLLTATAPGSSGAITVTASDDDGNNTDAAGLSRLVYDPAGSGATNLNEIQAAQDAQIKIDGQTVTRSSNTISDALDGVTLNLVAANAGSTVNVSVAVDTGAARAAIDSFVTSYNALSKTISAQSAFDSTTGQHGALLGDSTLRAVERALSRGLSATVGASGNSLAHLSDLGIAVQTDGTLSTDGTKLTAALSGDLANVGQFFGGTDGFAVTLGAALKPYTEVSGIFDQRTGQLNNRVSDINDGRAALDRRMSALRDRLQRQFTAMDAIVGQLQATSGFLTQQLANLPGAGGG